MKRLSWKYMAGFVDGEGCIDVQFCYVKAHPDRTYIRPRLRVTLAENCKFILDILKTNFGGSLSYRNLKKKNPVWQNAWSWTLEGKRLRPILQNLVNHLEIKKEQAKLSIWFLDHLRGKHLPNEMRKCIHEEMKAMKRDPQRLSEVAERKLVSYGVGLWSPYSDACLFCGTTKIKHVGNGHCDRCYQKIAREKKKRSDATVQLSLLR